METNNIHRFGRWLLVVSGTSSRNTVKGISPDELKIDFPSGAKIHDQIRDAYYTVP